MKVFFQRNFLNLWYAYVNKQLRLIALSIIRAFFPGHATKIKRCEIKRRYILQAKSSRSRYTHARTNRGEVFGWSKFTTSDNRRFVPDCSALVINNSSLGYWSSAHEQSWNLKRQKLVRPKPDQPDRLLRPCFNNYDRHLLLTIDVHFTYEAKACLGVIIICHAYQLKMARKKVVWPWLDQPDCPNHPWVAS